MTRFPLLIFLTCAVPALATDAARTPPRPSAEAFVASASTAYLRRDYPAAIRLYTAALEQHRRTPVLDRDTWRVAVDNLGMSYGISGDNRSAQKVFEYGISVEPDYPMFHYNRACALAEQNDLDGALEELTLAFAHKKNMMAGERMPDPRTDSSFSRFRQDAKFQRTVAIALATP